MLDFPEVKEPKSPKMPKMSAEQYIEFCDFCVESNPHITPENCLRYKENEQRIKEAFHF